MVQIGDVPSVDMEYFWLIVASFPSEKAMVQWSAMTTIFASRRFRLGVFFDGPMMEGGGLRPISDLNVPYASETTLYHV